MKINPGKSKAVSFTKAKLKERIRYYFGDQLIPGASSFKYLGIIISSILTTHQHLTAILHNRTTTCTPNIGKYVRKYKQLNPSHYSGTEIMKYLLRL